MLGYVQVKNLLLMKDITQIELAEYLGVTKSYISMLTNGKQPFSDDNYKKIIEYINSSNEFRADFKIKMQEKKKNEKSVNK